MASRTSLDDVLSHWSTLIENLQASPLEFYNSVEAAVDRREVPETTRSRVDYRESGAASARREYLHVERDRIVFALCAAPFGTGFFVSWWLCDARPRLGVILKIVALFVELLFVLFLLSQFGFIGGTVILCSIVLFVLYAVHTMAADGETTDDWVRDVPILGSLYRWLFRGSTFYRLDTAMMFQQAVHNAVLEVIDEITVAKGLRALAEADRKPVLREFYQRNAL